jgi:hypothetical protein
MKAARLVNRDFYLVLRGWKGAKGLSKDLFTLTY